MELLHQLDDITSLVWKDAFVVFSIILVYDGVRILTVGGQTRRGIKTLVSGVSLLLVMIAMAFWVSHTMGKLNNLMSTAPRAELSSNWGADTSPEKREYASRVLASFAYVDNGLLTKYFDKQYGWKPYCPNEKDIALRDQKLTTKMQVQQVENDAGSSIYRWVDFGLISAFVGWFAGRKERKNMANPPLNPDAPPNGGSPVS
ncbi:MAG TPA: hypothetical protein VMV97_04740 [Sulfuriferula sp.]|nr:hypothetical protein [Sulfuriferula sp.]